MTGIRRQKLRAALERFARWHESFGETSYDHQSFYAGPIGRRAKELYYRRPRIGILAVSPMVFFEAFLPSARRLFGRPMRLPIADAHYAMGYALMSRMTGEAAPYAKAVHHLDVLIETRCPDYSRYGWGYPFDWVTQKGTIKRGVPLITTTPYVYEAFASVHAVDGQDRWLGIMRSIAEHAELDYGEFPVSPGTASSAYFPGDDEGGVVNASAYRAALLTQASLRFGVERWHEQAGRHLRFVLGAQRPDGSWPYAAAGTRDFIDHFHTCFVLKALAKVERAFPGLDCRTAIEKGVAFYLAGLFDPGGRPKPFYQAPRLTVYRNELYDCAECVNLGVLLRGRFPELDRRTDGVVDDLLDRWQKPDGSFRSRRLLLGWDGVPMHRWGQSQVFRSLGLYLEAGRAADGKPGTEAA